MELRSTVTLRLMMRDGETVEQAETRMADLLWDLCNVADHELDFWTENVEVLE